MKSRILFVAALLSLSTLALAWDTYEISLSHTSKAGSVEIKAGRYTMKVDKGVAVLTNISSGEEYMIGVKMQNTATRFSATHVDIDSTGAVDAVKDIQLGGTTTQIEFD
ncbi:MAG TPA: hypothetical protein VML19_07790 [Verrucomicrobiae bacterium]|nr:hypothetical protein [Verrucomicrobiae bacterium]